VCRVGHRVIGFAFDGHLIYGRYLSSSAPGFASPLLDACGGHQHTSTSDVDEHGFNLNTNYHYHTQAITATCGSGEMCTEGETCTLARAASPHHRHGLAWLGMRSTWLCPGMAGHASENGLA
jgi:hypothetical protein